MTKDTVSVSSAAGTRWAICSTHPPRYWAISRLMISGRGVHCALHAASATGSDCAVDQVSAIDRTEPVAKTRPPRTRSVPGESRRAKKTTAPLRARGTSMSPYQSRWACRSPRTRSTAMRRMWVRQAGMPAVAGLTRQHDDADAEQHGEDRDELPVGQQRRGEPHPPVETREVTVGRRVPAGEAGEREQLDVDGEHAEHAHATENIEGPDPRSILGPRRLRHAATLSQGRRRLERASSLHERHSDRATATFPRRAADASSSIPEHHRAHPG